MKVLFYPLIDHSLIKYPLQKCDYMNDCLFHGLRSLLGENLIDSYYMDHMYNTYTHKSELYGNGFTIFGKLDNIHIDRENIEEKIRDRFFDQIIIPIHNNRFRAIDSNIQEIKKIKSYGNVLKIVDGNDNTDIYEELTKYGTLFKRELIYPTNKVLPISFGIPEEYIVESVNIDNKIKTTSDILPCYEGKKSWTFTIESEYRKEYQQSLFGYTCKKCGWDCLRHYEIIGNGCLPIFNNIDQCPKRTLTTIPKVVLQRINIIYQAWKQYHNELQDIASYLNQYAKQFLTTKYIAQRILE